MSGEASTAKCALCGEPMPEGEEMFKYHGYSGPCPKPPSRAARVPAAAAATEGPLTDAAKLALFDTVYAECAHWKAEAERHRTNSDLQLARAERAEAALWEIANLNFPGFPPSFPFASLPWYVQVARRALSGARP